MIRNRLIILLGAILISSSAIWSQEDFYAIDHIPEVRIYFTQDNWDELLDSLYIIGSEARLGGDVSIDGVVYPKIGVRYKGYSSYSSNRDKNPFNIDLDYALPDQNHQGYKKIKLSNVIQDPSFVREALSYEISRQYMPASKANFANVYVNDTLIGLYTNVEAVNSDFLENHFGESENTFLKCNPETVNLNGENSNLSNSPGTDLSSYYSLYDMKSTGEMDWQNLYELIDVLNNDPANIEEILNVDRTLWMHALNYVLINFDSYIGYAQNYYLYQTDDGKFQPILWDMNMSFASYRLTDASDHWDGFSIGEAKTIDPLQHLNSFSVQPRPLIRNILENDRYKKMYLAHIKTIVEEQITSNDCYSKGQYFQSIIDQSVQNDTNKFYTYTQFQENIDSTVTDLVDYPGIKDLMDGRANYLLSYPGMDDSPTISSVYEVSPSGKAHSDLWITATVQSPLNATVYIAYRESKGEQFQFVEMSDDGLNGDGSANDNVYGFCFSDPSFRMQYYIYVENDSIGAFYPARAAYEFITVGIAPTTEDVVVNEIMMENLILTDNNDEYEPWIELHNASLADIPTIFLKLVSQSSGEEWGLLGDEIQAGGYRLLWLDGESDQGENHCGFKPSYGDTLSLQYIDGTEIESFVLDSYDGVTSYGRWPNGNGSFRELIPTPEYENGYEDTPILDDELFVYPNPASDVLSIRLNQEAAEVQIYTMDGRMVKSMKISSKSSRIFLDEIASGVYMLVAKGENFNQSERIIIKK